MIVSVEKINELLIGAITLAGGFLTKRIFSKQDRLEEKTDERIKQLEKIIVTKADLKPLERTTDMILTHILNKK